MKQSYKKIVIALAVVAVVVGARFAGVDKYVNFESLKLYKDQLVAYVDANYVQSAVLFVIAYILITGLSLPGAAVMSLGCGFLFGLVGLLYANFAASVGAVGAFLVSRYLLGDWVQGRYGERLAAFNKEIETHGKSYLLTLRLIPLFPFFLINLLAGLTTIPLRTFIWTTVIGIIPGGFVYIYAGTQLGTISSVKDVFSGGILTALILLGIFAVVPVILKKRKMKKETQSDQI